MWQLRPVRPVALFVGICGILAAAPPAKVDFANDVLPILRQNCVSCHGPAQQSSGMRLDRKSSVITRRGVVPGNSDNSFLYFRISGNAYGMQMPPTGALRPEQIQTIKTWIDQGADWPDSLANEVEVPPLNPKAVASRMPAKVPFARPTTASTLTSRSSQGFMFTKIVAEFVWLAP